MIKNALSLPLTIVLLAAALSGFAVSVAAQTPDDNIPNALAYSWGTNQQGDLDFAADTDDVYRFDLKKGMLVSAVLSGDAGTDFDMYLFGPDAVNILEDKELLAAEKLGTSAESMRFTASKDGTHYLNVATWDTKGSYTLLMKVRPKVTIARSRTVYDYNSGATAGLSGAMDPPRASVRLGIEAKQAGSGSYASIGSATTGADGKYSHTIKPFQTATYRAKWTGDNAYLGATSDGIEIQVKPKVDGWKTGTLELASKNATSPTRPKYADLTGSLRSSKQLPSGVLVYIEIKESSASDWTRVSKTTSSNGAFSYRFESGQIGSTFQVRARFPGETRWLGVTSATRTIKVYAN